MNPKIEKLEKEIDKTKTKKQNKNHAPLSATKSPFLSTLIVIFFEFYQS